MDAQAIVDKYLGLPYKHLGRDFDGFDCWGLIKYIYKDIGIELFDINTDYDKLWGSKGKNYFMENYYKDWIKVREPRFLDIVGLYNNSNVINHAGIMLDRTRFIHSRRGGVVINNIYDFGQRVQGFYRHKKLNDKN